jgi:hypothetical protein
MNGAGVVDPTFGHHVLPRWRGIHVVRSSVDVPYA